MSAKRVVGILMIAFLLASAVGAADAAEDASAQEILDATGVRGGLIVHLGCGDGKLTAALRANDSFLVQGLDRDAKNVEAARKHIRSLGVYGNVSAARLTGNKLPYIENLVNLVVAEDLGGVSMEEVLRVLAPNATAYVKSNGKWTKTVKPRPKEIDEWTHYLHSPGNNAVAHDSVVGPPRHLQWQGSPRWSRQHDHMSSVSAVVSSGERVFYIFDEAPRVSILLPPEWKLIARDAFNGTILWKRDIGKWYTHMTRLKSGPAVLPRRLVAVGDRVYVTLGIDARLTALDAATGRTIHEYKNTDGTQEILVSDGAIFLAIRETGEEDPSRANVWAPGPRRVVAIEADGGKLLWQKQTGLTPLTLAADAASVYFHDGEKVVCLNRKDGVPRWTSEPLPIWAKIASYFGPTLVVYKDVVLFAGGEKLIPHRGGRDTMTALAADSGRKLWSAEHPPSGYQSPEDLLVADGLVWTGATTNGGYDGIFTGRDPKTGQVEVKFGPDVSTYWFHHRCYRGKATDNFLLMSRTGIEFLDIHEKKWMIHHWIRGACLYGIMPCNGLIYAPQHPCACYPEAKQYGFSAVAAASKSRAVPKKISDDGRLERGEAYGQPVEAAAGKADWPTFRHDAARSGRTKAPVPADLGKLWATELKGRLSSPVVAGGKLFVAAVDEHTLHAIDAGSGKKLWCFTAGGRVDSPPTVWQGRVLFGSADGCVYCLRADDGKLIWRFRAAPLKRQLVYFEQVESVWPVHGSVLVQDGVVSFVAGRSMFLDGGLRLLRLDPKTGKKLSETLLDDRNPETGKNMQDRIMVLNMPVALPDILSSDGKRIYMKSQAFDMEGNRQALGPHSGNPGQQGAVQRGEQAHLFCPSGFLDDSWWHRTYWVFGRSFAGGHGGYFQAGKFAPSGRIIVFDDDNAYAFGRKQKYYRWTTPLEHHLFSADKRAPEPAAPAVAKKKKADRKKSRKAPGPMKFNWSQDLPLFVRAMVLADRTLFIAGPPDLLDEDQSHRKLDDPDVQAAAAAQVESLAGRKGSKLWAVSADDGQKLAEHQLDVLPLFDGMIAANGRLYMATKDGRIICLGSR